MNIKSSLLFAIRILFPRTNKKSVGRKSLLGSILCIGISIVPLIVVLTVSNGMIEGITQRIISLSTSHLTAFYDLYGETEIPKDEMILDAENALQIEDITYAFPILENSSLVAGKTGRCGASIRAIPRNLFSEYKPYTELFSVEKGNLTSFTDSDERTVLIGKGIAEKLKLDVNDSIFLITTSGTESAIRPKFTRFKVSAIISCGYQELDSLWVFIPFDIGATILSPSNTTASIMLETPNAFSKNLSHIQHRVNDFYDWNLSVYRWDELNKSQFENFASTKMLLVFIMLLIVLVASVNISSALVMLVMERRKEIAILKSLGGSSKGITFSFLIAGLFSGVSGIILGLPVGIVCSLKVNSIISFIEKVINFFVEFAYILFRGNSSSFNEIHLLDSEFYLQTIPVNISFWDLFLICSGTLILSLIVSIVPATNAGKEKPLEILRKVR